MCVCTREIQRKVGRETEADRKTERDGDLHMKVFYLPGNNRNAMLSCLYHFLKWVNARINMLKIPPIINQKCWIR